MDDFFKETRNSKMEFDEVYFWTNTVKDWIPIFINEEYKTILLSSLSKLVNRQLIIVYGFVLMPNHLHLIWEMKELNGNESPVASFNKFTSHQLAKKIQLETPTEFRNFQVDEVDR